MIPDYRQCKFSTYGYRCNEKVIGAEYCEKHDTQCVSCGAPATHGCDFCGQFVCGAPLCDNCTYASDKGPSGTWGFLNHVHIRKGAELPSVVRERESAEEQRALHEAAFVTHAEDTQ